LQDALTVAWRHAIAPKGRKRGSATNLLQCFQILILIFVALFAERFERDLFLLQRVICLRRSRRLELCTSLSVANLK
jgi:hypothetical protein